MNAQAPLISSRLGKPSLPIGTPKTVASFGVDVRGEDPEIFWVFVIRLKSRREFRIPKLEYSFMSEIAPVHLAPAQDIVRTVPIQSAPNGIQYGTAGDTQISSEELGHLVQAVPQTIAGALRQKTYYFVPLTMAEPASVKPEHAVSNAASRPLLIATGFSSELIDSAVCHRDANLADRECVFISTRLMQDRFALAFEFYINAGHHFVDAAGVPEAFMRLVWSQAATGVRGETSQDAWEFRSQATGQTGAEINEGFSSAVSRKKTRRLRVLPQPTDRAATAALSNAADEKARNQYLDAAFADTIAIYLLSLTVDFDYAELREREYPLLAAPALAQRLRLAAELFPPNSGYEFSIRDRRAR
jgi:hypothetical protein